MTSILFEKKARPQGPDPFIIALYSIVPGIGQLYNGKTRKGCLFLAATFISLLMLYGSINPESTLDFAFVVLSTLKMLLGFIFKFNLEPSPAAPTILEQIKFGSSFSYCLIVLIICFVAYSMIDAYLDAQEKYKQYEYRLMTTSVSPFLFSESTTSSYILHTLALSILFLLSLYLVFPKKDTPQITEIEFIMPQIESKEPPPETKRRSTVQSIDQGKNDPKKPITPPQMSQPAGATAPKQVQAPQMAVPKQEAPQQKPSVPKPVAKPVQEVKPQQDLAPAPKMPAPMAAPKTNVEGFLPAKNQPAPIVGQGNNSQGKSTGGSQQVPPAPDSTGVSGGQGTATTRVAVVPRVPGLGGAGGLGSEGNPAPNSNPNGPSSLAAKKDIDFGPYMEELQRRIKRAWTPPRGNESKRVIVIFKVHKSGDITDLRISKSSGYEPSDQAALLAVKTASPFSPLPQGSHSPVEIEFTFDYNVFGAR